MWSDLQFYKYLCSQFQLWTGLDLWYFLPRCLCKELRWHQLCNVTQILFTISSCSYLSNTFNIYAFGVPHSKWCKNKQNDRRHINMKLYQSNQNHEAGKPKREGRANYSKLGFNMSKYAGLYFFYHSHRTDDKIFCVMCWDSFHMCYHRGMIGNTGRC